MVIKGSGSYLGFRSEWALVTWHPFLALFCPSRGTHDPVDLVVVSQSGLSGELDTYIPAEFVASRVILSGEKVAFDVQSLPFSSLCTWTHSLSPPEGSYFFRRLSAWKADERGVSTSFDGFILVGGSELVAGIYGAPTICLALVSLTWHLHLLEYSLLVFDMGLSISRISGMSSEAAEKAHGLA